jgi:hypothetical protein
LFQRYMGNGLQNCFGLWNECSKKYMNDGIHYCFVLWNKPSRVRCRSVEP